MDIMSKLFERSSIGIDLGSANMRVWVKGKGLVMDEPSVVAISTSYQGDSKPRVLAVGTEALELVGNNNNEVEQGMGLCCQGEEKRAQAQARELAWLGVLEKGSPLTRRLCVSFDAHSKPGDSAQILPHIQENASYVAWARKGRVISDVEIVAKILRHCFTKAKSEGKSKLRKPRVVIAVPSDITEVEKRALEAAACSAGAGKVLLFDSCIAAALGAECAACGQEDCMVVDIGASETRIMVASIGNDIVSASCRFGGNEMNSAIIKHMRNKHNLLIDEREAENIKIQIGSAQKLEEELVCEINGNDLVEGNRRTLTISSREIREEAVDKVLGRIEDALTDFIKFDVSQGIVANLKKSGVVLTGGGALLRGLDKRLAAATGLPVCVVDDPAHATIRGIGIVLNELDFYVEGTCGMNLCKKWLAPARRVLALVAIRGAIALLLAGLCFHAGRCCSLREFTFLSLFLLFAMPWLGWCGLILGLLGFAESFHNALLCSSFCILGIALDCVLVSVFILAKRRKDRWAAFAIHLAPLVLGYVLLYRLLY